MHHAILWCVGIDKLQFQPNGDISGMVSAEGELVPLKTRIKPSAVGGAVEKWLIQVTLLASHPVNPSIGKLPLICCTSLGTM